MSKIAIETVLICSDRLSNHIVIRYEDNDNLHRIPIKPEEIPKLIRDLQKAYATLSELDA